jgi:hypothetical protein
MPPDSTTNKSKSGSPARKTVWPSSKEHEVASGASDANSSASSRGKAIGLDDVAEVSVMALLYAGTLQFL